MLTVLEAYTRDVGRGVARIDDKMMVKLGLSKGDVIEIKGKRRTVANCLPNLSLQELEAERVQRAQIHEKLEQDKIAEKNNHETDWTGRNIPACELKLVTSDKIIRIDGLTRNNAGIAIGDKIEIRKVNAVDAEQVAVSPLEAIPPIDERYLADALENFPLIKGDNVMVPYFGGRLTFQVMEIIPHANASLVTHKTSFHITNQGPTMRDTGSFKYYRSNKELGFVFEDIVRKEDQDNVYLILKFHLTIGGFGSTGEFQIKLEKNELMQPLVSRYREKAQEIVSAVNEKLLSIELDEDLNPANLLQGIKFNILANWERI